MAGEESGVRPYFLTEEGDCLMGSQTRAGQVTKLSKGASPIEVDALWYDGYVERRTPTILLVSQIKSVTLVTKEKAWKQAAVYK